MNDSDREEFYRTWGAAWESHGKSVTAAALKLAFECLRDYDLRDIQRGVLAHAKDVQAGQFPPKPADIIRKIEGLPEDRAVIAWALVERGIRGEFYHQANYVVFDDPVVHRVIDDMGGFSRLGRGQERDLPFTRKDFIDRYLAYWRRGGAGKYPKRIRTGDYISKQMQDTLFLGDQTKAMTVLEGGSDVNSGPRELLEYIA